MSPDFSKGLVPAVVQNADTGKVLMLGYLDEESWARTRETGRAWFHSRERDAVLMRVRPAGPACHTGAESCFFNRPG